VIVIHCRFGIPEDARAAWTESACRMAERSRTEHGCLEYAFSFDVNDPCIAYSYQEWADQESLDAHERAPHHDERMEELKQWQIEYQKVAFYGVAWQRDQVR